MEFYLVIHDGRVRDVRFWTNGCAVTRACGEFVACMVEGRTLEEAMGISAARILDGLSEVQWHDRHCAILTVMTLYKALGDYLLKP